MYSRRVSLNKETSLLLRPNNYFFLTRYFEDTYSMVDKKLNLFIYLSPIAISPNNSVKICPRKQKTDMLYQMDNTFHTLSQYPV